MDIFKKAVEDNDVELLISTRATKNVNKVEQDHLNFGDIIADKLANFAGSWKFIIIIGIFLLSWVTLNGLALFIAFDPFPYILLNLVLGCASILQAPIIMMSQNRQSKKSTLMAELDYNLNLKSEMIDEEVMKRLTKLEENQKVILGNQIKLLKYLKNLNDKEENKE